MKHKILTFAVILFILLVAGLEWFGRYHFFIIEQYQLFLLTGDYFCDLVARPGGLALWLAEFFVQFFAVPYMGAPLTALILTGTGVSTALVCRRMAPGVPLWLPGVLPVLGLLCVSFDFNYLYQGSVALLGVTALLWLWVKLPRFGIRLVAAAVALPFVFWWFGSVAMLFALCVVLWEALSKTRRWWLSLVITMEAVLVAWAAVHFSFVGDWKFALTPMLYFHNMVEPTPQFWFAWVGLPVAIVIARLCRRIKINSRKREAISVAFQLALVALLVWKVVTPYSDPASNRMKKIDRHVSIEDWDAVIELSKSSADSDMALAWLNLALAGKGALADDMFKYDQWSVSGLIYPWDRSLPSAIVRSDIFFSIGAIAGAQEMAFEGYVSAPGNGSARLLKRLVQTNLIYGAWPVAEKYLDILSRAPLYRDWADRHRRLLYDNAAVDADPLLGMKRRCLPDENRFFKTLYGDFELVARQNPSSRTAIEYLGALALLAKDQRFFCAMIESYYGTEILPALPRSFQEAIVIFYRDRPDMWERYGVAAYVQERFGEFSQLWAANRDRQGLAGIMHRSWGDTYWYYLMFK